MPPAGKHPHGDDAYGELSSPKPITSGLSSPTEETRVVKGWLP
ncbi:MAG: hypothetical protein QXR57_04710 [Metallosphaera sp.]